MIEAVTPTDLKDNGAWQRIEAKLRPFVAKRVPLADVDDVIQEVFIRMQRGLPRLRDEQCLGPWIYQVARSAVIDHVRAAARRTPASHEATEVEVASDEEDEQTVEQEVATYAAFFVTTLPSPYREALTLIELQGLSQKEAAEMLGISLSAMKSRVQRGRQKLRTALEECCHIALDARHRVVGCEPRPDGKVPEGCCP